MRVEHGRWMRTAALAAMLPALIAANARAQVTAGQKCEAGKNQTAGKYAACMSKAEKRLVLKGDAAKYAAALAKCAGKYGDKWDKLEEKAASAGDQCPSVGDQAAIQDFLNACTQGVAEALGGGELPFDVVSCNADLATCTGDLETCDGSLDTCGGDLDACSGDLGVCAVSLGTCTSDLDAANSDLVGCAGDLDACGGDLDACSGNLGVCAVSLGTCTSDLDAANSDLVGCAGDLDACGEDLGECEEELGEFSQSLVHRVFVSAATQNGDLGGLPGADALCQGWADAADLGGTWVAWLSTDTVDARYRIPNAQYRLVNGTTVVANSKYDLLDGSLVNSINRTESGGTVTGSAFTATGADGHSTFSPSTSCSNWTSTTGTTNTGNAASTSSTWTVEAAFSSCSDARRLYCFETTTDSKLAFVTSATYDGNLGGLAGADAKCQALADAQGGLLEGKTWRAWLSTADVDARDRIPEAAYRRIDGKPLASRKADLLDGFLANRISVSETGSSVLGGVWTGTWPNGTAYTDVERCDDWTNATGFSGVFGNSGVSRANWTLESAGSSCSDSHHLYCFEE